MTFFAETVISGLLTGVMYSLVALGFVLIYKASGVFNFAQGVMALFAALTLTGLMNEYHVPVWGAIPLTILVMIALAFVVEWAILRRLVNQEPIVLFMATLGLAYILEGLGDIVWGPDVKVLDLGLPEGANNWLLDNFNIYIERIEIVSGRDGGNPGRGARNFLPKHAHRPRPARSRRRPSGRALCRHLPIRDLGDGVVGRGHCGAGGGHHVGCEVGCAVLAFAHRAEGAARADPWRLHQCSRRYRWRSHHRRRREACGNSTAGPIIGGAIENWFAYVLALMFLLVRPQGLFGEKIIERI